MKTKSLCLLASLALVTPAGAASSEWTNTPGGKVRLIIDNPVQPASEVRGAIQINLDPGWKTYWREPGDAGVPPELDLAASTNVKSYALAFPTPHRFEDGNTQWAGYKKPVSLPVTLTLADPVKPAHLKGHAFLGICETICIPVTAEFDISVDNTPSDALIRTQVASAFDQLPGQATPSFGARSITRKDDHINVTVDLPSDDPNVDIFIAGDGTTNFGMSKLKSREPNSAVFSVPVVSANDPKPIVLHYTLVQGEKAVSGTIEMKE